MKKQTANEILQNAIATLTQYLIELSDVRQDSPEQFSYGEKTAYT